MNKEKVLLFNPYSNNFILKSRNSKAGEYLSKTIENERVYRISKKESRNCQIADIIEECIAKCIGNKITSKTGGAPFNFYPIISFQGDISKNKLVNGILEASQIKNNLSEITLYLNNHSSALPRSLYEFYKQVPIGYNYGKKEDLNFELAKEIIKQVSNSSAYKISIMGGNLTKYNRLNTLIKEIEDHGLNIELSFYFGDILDLNDYKLTYDLFKNHNVIINIVFTSTSELIIFLNTYNNFCRSNRISLILLVASQKEYLKYKEFTTENEWSNLQILPILNSLKTTLNNDVFICQKDICGQRYSEKKIHSNGFINRCFWGKIKVLPSGVSYTSFNRRSIGNIKRHTLNELAYNELSRINTWRLTRNQVEPCKKCIFCDLCPPISDYELNLNKFNLCSIYKLD